LQLEVGCTVMKTRFSCRCLLCQLEVNLTEQLGERSRREDYSRIANSSALLSTFPSIFSLTAHLRTCRSSSNGSHPADAILTELLRARVGDETSGLLRDIILLAFIPALHSTSRLIAYRYPWLSPDDTAQHLVASMLELLGSRELRDRNSHLAFAISRMLKRSMFGWAERETRSPARADRDHTMLELAAPCGDGEPFERSLLLRHFLFRCQREGLLTDMDLELLTRIKLEGSPRDEQEARYSNALRQKIKRLLRKLRLAARMPRPKMNHRDLANPTRPTE
jgi:hypothetical protein